MARLNASLRAILVVVGATIMLATYYVWHKPFTAPMLLIWGGVLLDIVAVLLLFMAAGGVGRSLLFFAPTKSLSRAERVGLEGMIGFGVMSWVALLIAWSGNFTQVILWSTLIVILLVTVLGVRSYTRDCFTLLTNISLSDSLWNRFLVTVVIFWLATALLLALMPPTAWDSLMYHMITPQRLLATGQLSAYPDSHYLGFPKTVEMLFAWAVGLFGRDSAAALVHYGAGILGLAIVAGLIRRHTEESHTAWFAIALMLSGFSFWLSFTREYVDLAIFSISAGALSVLVAWRHDRNTMWLIIMGILAGLAVGIKYTAGLLAIALGVVVLLTEPRRVVRNGVIMAGVALLVYAPWGLRGLVQYGNPFYPFFFGGLEWDEARSALFSEAGKGFLALGADGILRMLLLPFFATAAGTEAGFRYQFDSGVWLMPLSVLALVGWRRLHDEERSLVTTAGLLLLPMLVMWMISGALSGIGAQTRLVIPVFPAFAILSAIGFTAMPRWGRRPVNLPTIFYALLIFAFAASLLGTIRDVVSKQPLSLLLADSTPQEAREAYLLRNQGAHYAALQQLDDELPPGTRVMFAFEPRPYYCPPTVLCDPDAMIDHWMHPLVTEALPPDEIMAAWRAESDMVLFFRFAYDTFFLVNEGIDYKEENAQFLPALENHAHVIWEDETGIYQLWAWNEE